MAASIQVKTEIEKPGIVMVKALALADRQEDQKAVAGFFVRRRYQGDTFLLERPEEFSKRWMRFVDVPPKDWQEKLQLKQTELHDLMAENEPVFLNPVERRNRDLRMGMKEVTASRDSSDFDYGSGRMKDRS